VKTAMFLRCDWRFQATQRKKN